MSFRLIPILLAGAAVATAQTVTQIRDSGPRATSINVALLAEGYTSAEAGKFQTDAATKLQALIANEAFSRFAAAINGFAVFVASEESGTDIPSQGITRNTYFNSSFGYNGIDRLLTIPPYTPTVTDPAQGTSKVLTVLQATVPDCDLAILVVNTTVYGGSGGFPTVVSLNQSSNEVLLHEIGHSFANLTDEYVDEAAAPYYPPREFANATEKTVRTEIPWRDFILSTTALPTAGNPGTEDFVGLFEGAHYRTTGFYRPTYNSKMRSLSRPFGPVNLRAFAATVHAMNLNAAATAPVITVPPVGGSVASGQSYTLRVTATGAGPLTYQWRRDGIYVPAGINAELTLSGSDLAGDYLVEVTNAAGTTTSATVTVAPAGAPVFSTQPLDRTATVGQTASFSASATGATVPTYQWFRDGRAIAGATGSTLTIGSVQPADAGVYSVVATNSLGSTASREAVLGLTIAGFLAGDAFSDPTWRGVFHPNGNRYTQVLLTGPAASVTAEPNLITRVSFIDLQDDIVQLEFSGAGTMTITLAQATGPAAPVQYAQNVQYMRGHASIVIQDADATTNFAAFSVGRLTAFDPTGRWDLTKPVSPTNDPANNGNPIFRNDVSYDGHADLARVVIGGPAGKFGGFFAANAAFSDGDGLTGVVAPNVSVGGVVRLHDLRAADGATPALLFLATPNAEDGIRVTGGDMEQANARAVRLGGVKRVLMSAGTDSHNRYESAQTNRARYETDGADVTTAVVVPAGTP